jgi:hypothetical protein
MHTVQTMAQWKMHETERLFSHMDDNNVEYIMRCNYLIKSSAEYQHNVRN